MANLGTLPTRIPAAIGMVAAPKKKKAHMKVRKSVLSKVIEHRRENMVARTLKITHNVSAFGMPLSL